MARISPQQYKNALRARYRDLRDDLTTEASIGNIDEASKIILEMKAIINIARVNGVDVSQIKV